MKVGLMGLYLGFEELVVVSVVGGLVSIVLWDGG